MAAHGEDRYRVLARFWTKIFAVAFGLGVVSGIVLAFQFGTNWSALLGVTGNVIGPAIAYEMLTAFFLEASFLGVLLFGWSGCRPGSRVLGRDRGGGTTISAFWILADNSWMQVPAGHVVRDGISFRSTGWRSSSTSSPYRFAHMLRPPI